MIPTSAAPLRRRRPSATGKGPEAPIHCLDELKQSLQALAQPPDIQLQLYPRGAAKVDELALDFDHWRQCALGLHGGEMSADQRHLLDALDHLLESMSGRTNQRLWTEDALRTDPAWVEVRKLAAQSLVAFGWPNQCPPPR